MSKTINDLKLGDSVWLNRVEMLFAGFNISPRHNMFLTHDDMVIAFCFSINDERISLTEPPPKLKRGQPVWVKDHAHALWMPRFFICFRGKRCIASDPAHGWHIIHNSGVVWDEWKLPTRQELIDAGIDPEAWESMD